MERGTMISAGAALQTPTAQEIPAAPVHPITWPMSCFSPAKPSTYQGSVLATSLTPGSDIWSAAHHQWKGQISEEQSATGHDDSGISPGRTSSSGPSSVGGSPPAAKTAEAAGGTSSSMFPVKEEQPDKDQAMSIQDEDSSISSEDNVDSYASRSPGGHPIHLRCPLCGASDFESIPSLVDHCKSHPESNISTPNLNCSICSLASLSKETFLAHLVSHLPQEHHCTVCGFSSKSLQKLNAHLAEFHGLAPADNNNETIVTRVNSGHGKAKSFKCKQCTFVTHTKLEFWGHSKCHIKSDKVLSCPRCPFVTEYKHHLEYHLRNHSGSKPFKCPQCPYTCVNKSMLNSHLKSHSNVYQYRCADCNYVTKYCHSLKLHLRKYMHSPAMVLNPDGTPNPLPIIDVYGTRRGPKVRKENQEAVVPPSLSPLKCPQCEFRTTSESQYQQHLLTGHPVQQPVNPLKEYLSWMYAQQMGLMQHFSATALNPLDLRKETPPPQPPPSPPSASKNRRKGKAPYKLQEANYGQDEIRVDVEDERDFESSPRQESIAAVPPSESEKESQQEMLNCGYCDIFFKDAVMYAMHMGYHGYKDPFHCNMCGEKTNDKLSFFLHIARSSHL